MAGEKLTFKTASIITLSFADRKEKRGLFPVFPVTFVSKISGHWRRVKYGQLIV